MTTDCKYFFFLSFAAGACLKSCVFQSQCFQNFPTTTNRKTFFYNVIWCVCVHTHTHKHLKQNFTKQYILSTLSNIFQFLFTLDRQFSDVLQEENGITYNRQDMEVTYLSINREMDKEDVVYIYIYIKCIFTVNFFWNSYSFTMIQKKTSTTASLSMLNPLTMWIMKKCKFLKELGILDHLFYILRNLYAGQEATVRNGHGTTNWLKIGKGVCQDYILSTCLFNLNAKYIT